jgi:hypothetical protein
METRVRKDSNVIEANRKKAYRKTSERKNAQKKRNERKNARKKWKGRKCSEKAYDESGHKRERKT